MTIDTQWLKEFAGCLDFLIPGVDGETHARLYWEDLAEPEQDVRTKNPAMGYDDATREAEAWDNN